MASVEKQVVDQLKNVGKKLLQPQSSTSELLNSLDELDRILSKCGQSPSQPVQEALLVPMKALIADDLIKSSDDDVKVTVASCLNEIMRISAPVAPYEDNKMKEFFELIVFSFNKLSTPSSRSYSKALSILESIARLRSCVMMLDLDCDPLLVKMFELFQKNLSSDRPPSMIRAMETIMILVINESDAVSSDLLKVLLASIRKENEHAAPISWKLGSKVIEECTDKLKPYILKTVKLSGFCLEDYAPILSSICKNEPDSVNDENLADKSQVVELVQSLKAVEHRSQNSAEKTDSKPVADTEAESGKTGSKKGKRTNSHNPDEGHDNRSIKEKSSPRDRLKKSPFAAKGEEKAKPSLENEVSKGKTKHKSDLDQKQPHKDTSLGDSSEKKSLKKKNVSGGSRSMDGASPKSTTRPSKKEKSKMSDASKSRKKQASLDDDDDDDDDVIETPHGKKSYKEDLVGGRIKVWWPLDLKYYEGTITSYEAPGRKHRVDYDDGDEEVLNLRKERWEFLGEETLDDVDLLALMQTPQRPSDVRRREGSTEAKKEASKTHTGKKRAVPDSCAKSDKSSEGSLPVTNEVPRTKKSEEVSDTKRTKLSDGPKS